MTRKAKRNAQRSTRVLRTLTEYEFASSLGPLEFKWEKNDFSTHFSANSILNYQRPKGDDLIRMQINSISEFKNPQRDDWTIKLWNRVHQEYTHRELAVAIKYSLLSKLLCRMPASQVDVKFRLGWHCLFICIFCLFFLLNIYGRSKFINISYHSLHENLFVLCHLFVANAVVRIISNIYKIHL